MNKIIKRAWVAALRSGEYEQGRGTLKMVSGNEPRYCCLGVLCEISTDGKWENTIAGLQFYRLDEHSESGVLPINLQGKIGLTNEESTALINMNDAGMSFEDIARYIEEKI